MFIEILNMNFTASFVILAVICVRFLIKKAPKKYSYMLWAIVFFRLICPFTIEMPASVVPIHTQTIPQDIIYTETPFIQSGVSIIDETVNQAMITPRPEVMTQVNLVKTVMQITSYFWLAGMIIFLLVEVISYLRLKKRIRTAIRVRGIIYETDQIETPFVLGFIRPRIYIPTGLGKMEFEYIIRHEWTHIKHFDYIIKPLAFFIVTVHWFNPLVWIAYAFMARDMEFTADESVMKHAKFDIRKKYARSLLALAMKKSGLLTPIAFGETGVKSRVKNIMHYKRPVFWVSILTAVIVICVSVSLVLSKPKETSLEEINSLKIAEGSGENYFETEVQISLIDVDETTVAPIQSTVIPPSTIYDKVEITRLVDGELLITIEINEPTIISSIEHAVTSPLVPIDVDLDFEFDYRLQYMIVLSGTNGESISKLYPNILYGNAYLEKDNQMYQIDFNFARYIFALQESSSGSLAPVASDAAALFAEYGWTLDYRINTIVTEINAFQYLSAFAPNAYYFTYNNELSKDIGLDMSGYTDKGEMSVEIYWIRESMPEEFYPRTDCRGIIVRNGTEIIGAFISAGRGDTLSACSLKGNSFEKVIGQSIQDWLITRVEADAQEQKMSNLSAEEVIEQYFQAIGNDDLRSAEYCLSKVYSLKGLTSNMTNFELFNEQISLPMTKHHMYMLEDRSDIQTVELISIDLHSEPDENHKLFDVWYDVQYKTDGGDSSGKTYWIIQMVYESPQTGWKIEGFVH